MNRTVRRWVTLVIVTFGLLLLNYPLLSGIINDMFAIHGVQVYQQEVEKIDDTARKETLEALHAYNEELAKGNGSPVVVGAIEYVQPGALLGYLEVPSINVYMAVRYGTTSEVLERDLGLMEGTSLPVGGPSTHACISGHTGMASRKMLTDLTAVKEGDVFFFHILGEDLAYKVDQIDVVLPSEDELLAIVPDEDYMTLITCTPYGVNDHRLLVRGTRIDYDFSAPASEQSEALQTDRRLSGVERMRYIVAAVSLLILLALIVFTIRGTIKDKKRREIKAKKAVAAAKAKLKRKGESASK